MPFPSSLPCRAVPWVRKGQEELAGHLPLHLPVCSCGQTPLFSVLRDLDGREVTNPEKKMFRVGPSPPPPEHCGVFQKDVLQLCPIDLIENPARFSSEKNRFTTRSRA